MKFDENLPIYLQVSDLIKQRIITGHYQPGGKLPSVRDLSMELRVNPNTIQRSYGELDREGLIFTQRGRGTFVVEDDKMLKDLRKDLARASLEKFFLEMENLGLDREDIITMVETFRRD